LVRKGYVFGLFYWVDIEANFNKKKVVMGDYVWPKRGRGQSDSRVVQFKRYYHDGAL
jgi:hypothetical protein